MTPVLITQDATLDDLSLNDYRDMVQELRQSMSLDKMIAALGSEFSKPLWADVEKGIKLPNRKQRNELRRLFNMPMLPPTVADAVSVASPDASVWMVGEGVPDTVVMVAGHEPVTLHVNGSVETVSYFPERLTCPRERSLTPVYRPMLDTEDHAALQGLQHKYTAKEIWRMGIKAARSLE